MKLFLLGGSGRTGKHVVQQGLSRGHNVTAVLRTPTALQPRERLRIVSGDPRRSDDLAPNLTDQDVVISCLGQSSRGDATLLRDATTATLEAMMRIGVRRYLVISQGLLFPSRNPIIALLRFLLSRHVADSSAMERLIQGSEIDWTIVRPPRLLEGDVQRGYRTKVNALPDGGWTLRYADLAAFLLDDAEKEGDRNAIVGVASA